LADVLSHAIVSAGPGIATLGPPRLYEGEASAAVGPAWWWLAIGATVAALLCVVVYRTMRRSMLSDERLALLMLARRHRLTMKQRRAVERLAARAGATPVALLICESAFARAAQGEMLNPDSTVEAKPVLLTGHELAELERVAERMFGEGCVQQVLESPDTHGEEVSDDTSQWVA